MELRPGTASFLKQLPGSNLRWYAPGKRAGVTYLGQSAAEPTDPGFSAATTQVLLNNAATLKVRDSSPIATAPQRFLRVQVTAAP